MKRLLIAGTWKSNKTTVEAKDWIEKFSVSCKSFIVPQECSIILFAPYTLLSFLHEKKDGLPISVQLGAQNISPFAEGAYTGEISARQIKEFANWVIIGHSERRANFGETDQMLMKKVEQAQKERINIIYCVQNKNTFIPKGVDVVAYEPSWAISAVSNWKAQPAQEAEAVCRMIRAKAGSASVVYGGSASPDNIASYMLQPSISGVLSGGASLDPAKFASMIQIVLTS